MKSGKCKAMLACASTEEVGTNRLAVVDTAGLDNLPLQETGRLGKKMFSYQLREESSLLVPVTCRYPGLLSLLPLCWG